MIFYFEDTITGEKFFNRNHIFSTNYFNSVEKNSLIVKYSNIFDRINWSIEPIESLESLFNQRALQIRSMYPYIILYFSGGSDSTTILQIFLKNGIPIDELVINTISDSTDIRHNGTVAIEYLNSIDYKGKITKVDINHEIFKKFFNKQLAFYDGYFPGFLHSILRMRVDFFEQFDLHKIIRRPSNVAHLYGEASPIIQVVNSKYYSQLMGIRNMGSTTYHEGNVHFFTSEDFPQLHVKQSHIIVNYFKEHFPKETNILESKFTSIYKKLLRYDWDRRADFSQKSTGMPGLLNSNQEASYILNFYKTKDERFAKDYHASYIKEYTNSNLYKKYKNTWPVITPNLGIPKYFIG